VSDPKQAEKDLSIRGQVRRIIEYCKRKNIRIRGIYREIRSARGENRPKFRKMIEEALQATVPPKFILTWNTSRFARNVEVAERAKRLLRRKGVRVIAISQEVSDDQYGRFMERSFENIDELRSEEIGIDTLRGMVDNARDGYISGGTPPFGYEFERITNEQGKVKLRFRVSEDEARVVELMYRLYLYGAEDTPPMGGGRIADYLNERGYRTRSGKPWEKQTVLEIIKNPVYAGTFLFNRRSSRDKRAKPKEEWVAVPVPLIIEKSLFDEAQVMRKARTHERKAVSSTRYPALLTGVLYHGACGGRMTVESGKGGTYPYYNCREFLRKGKSVCPGERIPREILEDEIKNHLASNLFTRGRIRAILKETLKVLRKQLQSGGSRAKEIEEEISRLSRRLSNISRMVEEWGIDRFTQLKDRANLLQDEIARFEEEKQGLTRPLELPHNLLDEERIRHFEYRIKSVFLDGDPVFIRKYLDLLVERIVVTSGEVKIIGKTTGLVQAVLAGRESEQVVLTGGGKWLPEPYITRTRPKSS